MKITILKVGSAYVLDQEGKEAKAFAAPYGLQEVLKETHRRFKQIEIQKETIELDKRPLAEYMMDSK